MGLIDETMRILFGSGRNTVAETVGIFRESAEGSAQRAARLRSDALLQFASEFAHERRGLFDRLVDGLNRLPRPTLALGTIGLFVAAMTDPVWFGARMQGVALIPEPLWWLMGAVVSFYFGARHQAKGQEFQRSVAQSVAMGAGLTTPCPATAPDAEPRSETLADNAALAEWQARHVA